MLRDAILAGIRDGLNVCAAVAGLGIVAALVGVVVSCF